MFPDFLAKAKSLITQGKLMDATRTIQLGLSVRSHVEQQAERSAESAVTDIPETPPSVFTPFTRNETPTDVEFREFVDRPANAEQSPTSADQAPSLNPASGSTFSVDFFEYGQGRYVYRLFIPCRVDDTPLPLVVMLHGCKQDSLDFATGTAMNVVAEREKFMVLYPEQLRASNSIGCWNWFNPLHQGRGQGEPGMIAALTSHVLTHNSIDPARVFVAGLSAGAAMAALMGQLYPEVFAAVGVHSGLAPGAARSVPSAFAAMAKGPGPQTKVGAIGIPVILFQGSGDTTVAPGNAETIIMTELASWESKGLSLSKSVHAENSLNTARATTRSAWKTELGKPMVEMWSVVAGPHAWSGGNAAGSFTDPKGPDASTAMFEFFKLHPKTPKLSGALLIFRRN